ncbi:unnamed protein product [Parajaminaea phylloscopi]
MPAVSLPDGQARKRRRVSPSHTVVSLSHPLNVKPAGNAIFLSAAPLTRARTLGHLAVLSDDLILHILSECGLCPYDVARLSAVSSGLRAFANLDSLWRNLFVEQAAGGRLESFHGSWKQTLAAHLSSGGPAPAKLASVSPPEPLISDLLYLPHRLSLESLDRMLPSPKSNPSTPIPSVTPDITCEDFHRLYAAPQLPCIIQHHQQQSSQAMPGLGFDIAKLSELYGEVWVRAEAVRTQVRTYADYARSCAQQQEAIRDAQRLSLGDAEEEDAEGPPEAEAEPVAPWHDPLAVPDESPYYLFDAQIPARLASDGLWSVRPQIERCPADVYDFAPPPHSHTPTHPQARTHADLFSLFGETRPDYRWLIAGPARSGSGWHKDPNYTSAWNTPLSGRKLWLMLPPDCPPPGVYVSPDGAEVTAPLSLIEWVSDFYAETKRLHGPPKRGRNGPASGGDGRLLEGICGPGETVYVPSGWWHLVVNLDESVALTQNLVSLAELPRVLHFMKVKHDQISGFKFKHGDEGDADADDCDDDDQKAGLFDAFVAALRGYDPALAEWGLSRMEAAGAAGAAGDQQVTGSTEAPVLQSKRAGNGGGGAAAAAGEAAGGWWERLKGERCEDGAQTETKPSTGFSFAADLGDGELGEVPW